MKTIRYKVLYTAIVGLSAGIAHILLYLKFDHQTMFMDSVLWALVIGEIVVVLSRPYKWAPKIITALFMLLVSPILPALFCFQASPFHPLHDLVALYSPFGTTFACLISIYFHSIFYSRKKHNGPPCSYCGSPFPSNKAFCPSCFKLTPEIDNTIKHFSNKKYVDFISDFRNNCTNCPHCGKYLRPGNGAMVFLDSPIQRCPKCKWYYLDHACCEWSLVSPIDHLLYLIRLDRFSQLLIVSTIELIYRYRSSVIAAMAIIMLIIGVLAWEFILIHDRITASKRRVENNPEYPQLLKYMGYENLIHRKLT